MDEDLGALLKLHILIFIVSKEETYVLWQPVLGYSFIPNIWKVFRSVEKHADIIRSSILAYTFRSIDHNCWMLFICLRIVDLILVSNKITLFWKELLIKVNTCVEEFFINSSHWVTLGDIHQLFIKV